MTGGRSPQPGDGQPPVIAITLGDPCGIGPEVVARALATPAVAQACRPLVVGDWVVLTAAMTLVGARLSIQRVSSPREVGPGPGTAWVLDPGGLATADVIPGRVSAGAGKASMGWVELAARLCMGGEVAAMATAPVNKEATSLAGYREIGHTEVLQRMTGVPRVATMLVSGGLRVVHLTTHRSLRRACDAVTRENVLENLLLTHQCFREWGFQGPRIGVAALNPHASDGGLLGDEEATQIAPAVEEARRRGLDATGPVPADIIFHQAIGGLFDVVLAMYHDQGHIPIKVHGFEESISVNLGLPFVRTSVDHGTAFDIAWRGVAQAASMVEAVRVAASLAAGRGLIAVPTA